MHGSLATAPLSQQAFYVLTCLVLPVIAMLGIAWIYIRTLPPPPDN